MSRYVRIHRRFVNLRPRPERAFDAPPRTDFLPLTALCRAPAVLAAFADLALEPAFRLRALVAFLAFETPFEAVFAPFEVPLDAAFDADLEPGRAAVPRAGGLRPAGRRPGARRDALLRADAFLRAAGAARSVPIASVTESIAAMPSVVLRRPFLR